MTFRDVTQLEMCGNYIHHEVIISEHGISFRNANEGPLKVIVSHVRYESVNISEIARYKKWF